MLNSILLPPIAALFWVFLKIGFVFFGGGYVVIPVMHRELVMNLHFLTEREFIDGTAISQLTPGPVAVLATFAGYRVAGVAGALMATIGIFLPGSVLMIFLSKSYERMKGSNISRNILNTLIPVIIGLLVAASWQIGKSAVTSTWEWCALFLSLLALVRFKVNPAILILVFGVFHFFAK